MATEGKDAAEATCLQIEQAFKSLVGERDEQPKVPPEEAIRFFGLIGTYAAQRALEISRCAFEDQRHADMLLGRFVRLTLELEANEQARDQEASD